MCADSGVTACWGGSILVSHVPRWVSDAESCWHHGICPPAVTHCWRHTHPPRLSSATGRAHGCSGWSSSTATDCGVCPEGSTLPHRWFGITKTQHQAVKWAVRGVMGKPLVLSNCAELCCMTVSWEPQRKTWSGNSLVTPVSPVSCPSWCSLPAAAPRVLIAGAGPAFLCLKKV